MDDYNLIDNPISSNLRSWIEIDLSAFRHNFHELKKHLPADTMIMQIVKADAYGHGALEISRIALDCGAQWLGVANADEGALLRQYGYDVPILILSPALISEIPLIIVNDLTPSVSDPLFAEKLNEQVSPGFDIHLNIDTGMGRSGAPISEALDFYELCQFLPNLNVQGIFTHFSAAENDPDYTERQISLFKQFLQKISETPQIIHSANSSAVIGKYHAPGNMVRLGALSYGFYTDANQKKLIDLHSVLKFKSRITQVKKAIKGDYIGYNRTYRCDRELRYAIIPVGYADGYDFLLSNCGQVMVNGKLLPVIGKVSMDMIAIDLTGCEHCTLGDIAVLIDENPNLRVENIAACYGGSSYELLCQTGRRAPRYFFERGKLVESAPQLRRDFVSSDYNDKKLNNIIEAAIHQRLQSSEIASFVYHDILKNIFSDQDNKIHFRHDFQHTITFSIPDQDHKKDYFLTETSLTYYKKLNSASFKIACANNEKNLNKYFLEQDTEYRWLLDDSLKLSPDNFQLLSAKINDIDLYSASRIIDNCLEITCYNEKLNDLIDNEVKFTINTLTWYPRKYHQLTVYLTGITHGFDLDFSFPSELKIENIIPVLAGKNKFPNISQTNTHADVTSSEWVFPSSGIIFIYSIK